MRSDIFPEDQHSLLAAEFAKELDDLWQNMDDEIQADTV